MQVKKTKGSCMKKTNKWLLIISKSLVDEFGETRALCEVVLILWAIHHLINNKTFVNGYKARNH